MTSNEFEEITEGNTKLIVPKKSLVEISPPKYPAFFNPRAKRTRDFSIIAYGAFLKEFRGPRLFLEGLSGVGARGIRVANELEVEKVVLNDLNPTALKIARVSSELNHLKNIEFSENEICRFFSNYSKKGERGSMVDIDPFGSPSPFFDCGIRATMHGGILSVTATDLQVLNGLFPSACKRRYGGVPIRTDYGNEIAIRLVLGSLRSVAARLDIEIIPLYVESDMHYYRVYVKVFNRPDQTENIGYIIHCNECGHRKISFEKQEECEICSGKSTSGGPLWIGKLFDEKFLKKMIVEESQLNLGKTYNKILSKCLLECNLPQYYYTLDEIASKMKLSPPKLEVAIEKLKQSDFLASPTVFQPTGFRTNASIREIIETFSD